MSFPPLHPSCLSIYQDCWLKKGGEGAKSRGRDRGDDRAALENLGCAWVNFVLQITRPSLGSAGCSARWSGPARHPPARPASPPRARVPAGARQGPGGSGPSRGARGRARRAAWIPRRRPRSAFSLPPGPGGRGRGARRRRGAGLGNPSALRLQPAVSAASRGRRRPTARPGTCQPRASRADFPEGRRGPHGDWPGSRCFARCPPSPTPDAADRSSADLPRRGGPSSRLLAPSRGVSGSPALAGSAEGLRRGSGGRAPQGKGRAPRVSLRGACDTQTGRAEQKIREKGRIGWLGCVDTESGYGAATPRGLQIGWLPAWLLFAASQPTLPLILFCVQPRSVAPELGR